MNERLKELAEQAGLEELGDGDWCSLNHPDVRAEHLERFAELVLQNYISQIMTTEEREENIRADEREACAKLCDELAESSSDHEAGAALNIREAIRARGKK